MNELENLKLRHLKRKRNVPQKNKINFKKHLLKIGILLVLTVVTVIILKNFKTVKTYFYKHVYEQNISFASINYQYKKIFGSPIPFADLIESKTKPVFNEKLAYFEKKSYQEGVKLIVSKEYLVPALETGMVIFIGDKENYPNTVIINGINGEDIWYTNVNKLNVSLYDYIEKGNLIGSTINDELILSFKKNGKVLDYNEKI
jgi:stage IV sporulation protein FA